MGELKLEVEEFKKIETLSVQLIAEQEKDIDNMKKLYRGCNCTHITAYHTVSSNNNKQKFGKQNNNQKQINIKKQNFVKSGKNIKNTNMKKDQKKQNTKTQTEINKEQTTSIKNRLVDQKHFDDYKVVIENVKNDTSHINTAVGNNKAKYNNNSMSEGNTTVNMSDPQSILIPVLGEVKKDINKTKTLHDKGFVINNKT